jgi:hypothetical protein
VNDISADATWPSLGITVTESVREGVRIIMFGVPCPVCGHAGEIMSLRDAAKVTGVSFNTIGRFLKGRPIDSDTLDRLYEWVNARLPRLS